MRIEIEYHSNDRRWYWRVYLEHGSSTIIVREGFERDLLEAERAARTAAAEYERRKVIEL